MSDHNLAIVVIERPLETVEKETVRRFCRAPGCFSSTLKKISFGILFSNKGLRELVAC